MATVLCSLGNEVCFALWVCLSAGYLVRNNYMGDKIMKLERRRQIAAAAVILNGFAALTLLTPRAALAAGCSTYDHVYCVEVCPGNPVSVCAPAPGCTPSGICVPPGFQTCWDSLFVYATSTKHKFT